MKILFITTIEISNLNESGIYTDLLREFKNKGHNLTVITSSSKIKKSFIKSKENNFTKLVVRTGKTEKVTSFKKVINLFLLNRKYKRAISKSGLKLDFDLIIFNTPPIMLNKVIKKIKNTSNAKTLLLLKDIFPQNAVDLRMFSNKGFIYRYYRRKEKNLYKLSDNIGCMSTGNVKYLLDNNAYINKELVSVIPNSIKVRELTYNYTKDDFNKKYNIPKGKKIFLYGGNLGKPQGIDYLIRVIMKNELSKNNFIFIVGDGVEYNKIFDFLEVNKIQNTRLIKYLPKDEYDKVVYYSDVGLILLDSRFTIPNIPSRILTYMENKKPVLAATDIYTDLKDIIKEGNFGYWCESNNENKFIELMDNFQDDKINSMLGNNGYKYLQDNYDVEDAYKKIMEVVGQKNVQR